MKTEPKTISAMQPHLLRRFGLLEATALNMTNMIGIGPFITIPLLLTTLGGPAGHDWLACGPAYHGFGKAMALCPETAR